MDSDFEDGSLNSVSISEGSNSRSSRSKKKPTKIKPKKKKGTSWRSGRERLDSTLRRIVITVREKH